MNESFNIKELFDEKRKAFIPKREAEVILKEKRFEKLQQNIEKKFMDNLKTLENIKTKEELLEEFSKLWKRRRRFKEHIEKRKALKHIPDKNPELIYIKQIFNVLSEFDNVFIEKTKSGSQIDYIHKDDWVVIINQNGKIETAYKLESPLSRWIKRHKIKNEITRGNINEEFKKSVKSLWNRIKLL